MRWASGVAVFLLVLVALGAAVIGLASHVSQSETGVPPPPAPVQAMQLPPPPVGSQWRYTAPRTAYASDVGEEACTKSEADVATGDGGRSGATLCLRRGGGYPYAGSIVLGDTRGQFVCAECAVRARFDDSAQSLDGTAISTDGADYALFFRDGPRLAGELKRGSVATFEVTIRGAGEQRLTFNIAGLKWRS
jgi:hypothetical protein